MPEFEGVVPAIITPMTADGEINEEAFRAVMEDNIQAGVHGFWTAGGTGESVLLTDDENGPYRPGRGRPKPGPDEDHHARGGADDGTRRPQCGTRGKGGRRSRLRRPAVLRSSR